MTSAEAAGEKEDAGHGEELLRAGARALEAPVQKKNREQGRKGEALRTMSNGLPAHPLVVAVAGGVYGIRFACAGG